MITRLLDVQEAAEEVQAVPPPDLDAEGRMDLTSHYIVTIDDASTKEIDDGAPAHSIYERSAHILNGTLQHTFTRNKR